MRVARTASTQEVVLRAARDGAAEGFTCLAAEQTAGRGRQGRAWVAPAGSALLASVLLRRSPTVAAGIPFAAGLALVDVLAAELGVAAGLKWPNDVLVDGRKLAGILCEVEPAASKGELVAVALGIGVNLTVSGFPEGPEAVSLHTLVARPPTGRGVACRVESGFERPDRQPRTRGHRRVARRLASLRSRSGSPCHCSDGGCHHPRDRRRCGGRRCLDRRGVRPDASVPGGRRPSRQSRPLTARAGPSLGSRVGSYVAGEGVADAEGEAPDAPAGAADPVTWITPFMFGAWMVQR